jgi:hypothetical protein
VPGQSANQYRSFDNADGRFALVIGYHVHLDVFVLWDASMHPRFTSGWNIQVRDSTVYTAAAVGRAAQLRRLSNGATEIVFACQSCTFAEAVDARVAATGATSMESISWPIYPT